MLIVFLDAAVVEAELAAGRLACPACRAVLGPWGYARERVLRCRAGDRRLMPRRAREGRAFFSFVIDVFSRKIVGWQFASHMRTDLVLDALRMALGTRQFGADVALVAHNDAGSQYTSYDYRQVLDDHRVLASVGSVGDAYDNAMAESFVDTFKTELIKDRVWETRTQMELAVVEWVAWFNTDRLHESLSDWPPVEVEDEWTLKTAWLTKSTALGLRPQNWLTRGLQLVSPTPSSLTTTNL